MKVTVIATGFNTSCPHEQGHRSAMEWDGRSSFADPVAAQPQQEEPEIDTFFRRDAAPKAAGPAAPAPSAEEPVEEREEIPFYRKVIAQTRGEDPGGFGPNWSNVDDFDIPTVLRKQMD